MTNNERMESSRFHFRTALNTSTIRPFHLDLPGQLRACAAAGFQGIELWVRDVQAWQEAGGKPADLRVLAGDLGVEPFDGIGFIRWADRDPLVRVAELEKAKQEMGLLAAIGCRAMAAPPCGDTEGVTIDECAERLARLWDAGLEAGVEPCLEMWGHRGNIRTVSTAAEILRKSGLTGAKLLVDPIHIHKGGGDFRDLAVLEHGSIGVVHVNDFPLSIDRASLTDKDRCSPGEGESDQGLFRQMILQAGYRGYLSLELFREDYGGRSIEDVLRHGLASIVRVF